MNDRRDVPTETVIGIALIFIMLVVKAIWG